MRRGIGILLGCLLVTQTVFAQVDPTGSISTAGSDCSTATRCVGWSAVGLPSFGVYINVATSGTFVYEVSQDASTNANGTWVAIDDSAGDANATADGAYYFMNTGFLRFRIRASAISGTATVTLAAGAVTGGGGGGAGAASTITQLEDGFGENVGDDANDAIRVNVVAGATSGTVYDHGEAITLGSINGTAIGGRVSAAAPSTTGVADDDFATFWLRNTGEQVIGGAGTAGSASANVVTVQGIASATPVIVSSPAMDATGTTVPADAIYLGVNVGGNTTGVTGTTEGSFTGAVVALLDPTTNALVTYDGCTTTGFISGASVNETAIKASAGRLYSIEVFSVDATPVYVKLYNDTTANIDETDTPTWRMASPANSTASLGAGFVHAWPTGLTFSTAITVRITTGVADNDTGALTANEVLFNACYI